MSFVLLGVLVGALGFLGPALCDEPALPTRAEVTPWLGRWTAGPDAVALRWDGSLMAELGRIAVAVDGRWHETVATFAVRHRLTWRGDATILLEEQHNEGAHWRYELRLAEDGEKLLKFQLPAATLAGEKTLVRTYRRQP